MTRFHCPELGRRLAALCALGILVAASPASAAYDGPEPIDLLDSKDLHREFALEGEFVHNVGELQINITNWGLIGSQPSRQATFSDAPSAMWPAGSGVDYLWSAGLWVGAVKSGVPLVSTGQFTPELLANPDDPLDTIYTTFQGAVGGARFPDPGEDDDGDGLVNEDPLNGIDDDGDGLIDEDFAAIGNQHFRAVLRDNTALAEESFPSHEPLDIQVVQETFQWENDNVDDFVGFQFTISNIGVSPLQDVYVGFFADCDIGARGASGVAEDDLPFFFDVGVRALDNSLVPLKVGVMYDDDGDAGQAPGFFGMLFLNHPTDPSGESAPEQVGITTFQTFSGQQTFEQGGDPNNDAERYELMSRIEIDSTPPLFEVGKRADFRMMMGSGPFTPVDTGEEVVVQAAFVVGEGPGGMLRNAAEAALTYFGAYFDRDIDPTTGVNGWETEICQEDFGPPSPSNPIFSLFQDCVDSTDLLGDNPPPPISENELDEDGCIYVDNDCDFEERRGADICNDETAQGIPEEDLAGCTGVAGKEFFVPWLVGLAPTAPNMRMWQTNNRVHVFWNNISEIVPDVRLQEVDFESYRVWRADGWDRPFGSSIENGPESRLWKLVAEFDKVNFFEDRREIRGGQVVQELPLGANTGLDVISYVPEQLREGTRLYEELQPAAELVSRILADPEFSFLGPTIDPSVFVRFIGENGELTPIGAEYPELQEWEGNYAAIDTHYWDQTGVKFYEYVDRSVHNGIFYFYSVTASDFLAEAQPGGGILPVGPGLAGDPQSNFGFATPFSDAQTSEERDQLGHDIYVVPNPATRESLAEFSQLNPNADDPHGRARDVQQLAGGTEYHQGLHSGGRSRADDSARWHRRERFGVLEPRFQERTGSGERDLSLLCGNGRQLVRPGDRSFRGRPLRGRRPEETGPWARRRS